jgi:hypothetical protein
MDSESFKNLSNLMIMKNALSNEPHQKGSSFNTNMPFVLMMIFVLYIIWKQQQDIRKEIRQSQNTHATYFNGRNNRLPFYLNNNMKFLN